MSPVLAAEMYRKRRVGTKVDEITRGKQLPLFLTTPQWVFRKYFRNVLRKQELWDADYETWHRGGRKTDRYTYIAAAYCLMRALPCWVSWPPHSRALWCFHSGPASLCAGTWGLSSSGAGPSNWVLWRAGRQRERETLTVQQAMTVIRTNTTGVWHTGPTVPIPRHEHAKLAISADQNRGVTRTWNCLHRTMGCFWNGNFLGPISKTSSESAFETQLTEFVYLSVPYNLPNPYYSFCPQACFNMKNYSSDVSCESTCQYSGVIP